MIVPKTMASWRQFEEFVDELHAAREAPRGDRKPRIQPARGTLYFRGQALASWQLETTLDRAARGDFSMEAYQSVIKALKGELEVFAARDWNWEDQAELLNFEPAATSSTIPQWKCWPGHSLANFRLMSYLRHHGFPSPLLDWTRSKYIAAYFATCEHDEAPWAIYILDETPNGVKVWTVAAPDPNISIISRTDANHRRHFLQQSTYSICTRFENYWRYTPFEQAAAVNTPGQDVVYKCIFEPEIRKQVIRMLNEMNITAFSLFGSEEALLKTLAARAFQGKVIQ